MKKLVYKPLGLFVVIVVFFSFTSCQRASANSELKASAFKQKVEVTTNKTLLDVRSPEEFAEGHLQGALNINWNGDNFDAETARLDKAKPVFVYCRSGKRSAAAAAAMRKMGFKEVYELKDGISAWESEGFPVETGAISSAMGMTIPQFEALLNTDKLVLVDFYATWCGPCKKMEPYLAEISKDMAATVSVVRIDADENPTLATDMKVSALPTVFIYKNQQLVWRNVGFVSRESMIAKLKSIK